MVSFPQTAYSNFVGTVVGEVCSSLSPAETHCLAPQLSVSDQREDVSVGLRRDCFQWLRPYAPLIQMVSMGSRWSYTCNLRWCLPSGSHTIKSLSLFQIKNNQISRDVKDLFLGHRFVWSRVIVKVPMPQLDDELLGKGRCNVRWQGTNWLGLIARLGRPIRVTFRDKIESLLRG
jgi:hypothetical protein